MQNRFVVIDGNSLMHRAYWGVHPNGAEDNAPPLGVWKFVEMLYQLYDRHQPTHLAVAFDAPGEPFRHRMYPAYKANRGDMPAPLHREFLILRNLLSEIGVVNIDCPDYEADDIVGAASRLVPFETYIVTGDRDQFQLITDHTTVVMPVCGVRVTKLVTPASLMDEMQVRPEQIPDLKGLMGDASDNLPGVRGIGIRTAQKLLAEWDTIDNLYAHLSEVRSISLRNRLQEHHTTALLCRNLTVIVNAPIRKTADDFIAPDLDGDQALIALRDAGCTTFVKRRWFL